MILIYFKYRNLGTASKIEEQETLHLPALSASILPVDFGTMF